MARNQYVNFYSATNEQDLIENLVVEAIKFYAHDVVYIPRSGVNRDEVFNENEYSTFGANYAVEVYVKNTDGFEGYGQFLSKFGNETQDELTLTMSRRSFNEFVGANTGAANPMQGDLIYVPMTGAVYEVDFVETASVFFQLGKLYVYDVKVRLFEYSNEVFDTGLPIDDRYNGMSTVLGVENDPFEQNAEVQDAADEVLDWTEDTPFGEF